MKTSTCGEKKIVQAIDRLLKKVEDEVMKGAEKVLAKALETATHSWDLAKAPKDPVLQIPRWRMLPPSRPFCHQEIEILWTNSEPPCSRTSRDMSQRLERALT